MTRSGSKRTRLDSLKTRKEIAKIGDVTLAEFANSDVPQGKGRLRKSKSVFHEVRKISTSEDLKADGYLNDPDDEVEHEVTGKDAVYLTEGSQSESCKGEDGFTEIPLKIWLLLADYVRPEDVKSFSLVCKTSLSVVNTPLFWIRLYKRYYTKKTPAPQCLSRTYLDCQVGLKQRVIRSLYYFYPPFVESLSTSHPPLESATRHYCLRHWVYSVGDKESQEGCKWIYNFKFCNWNMYYNNYSLKDKNPPAHSNDIHHNPEKGCSILRITGKEYIALPNVMGMRLKSVLSEPKSLSLTFGSATLKRSPAISDTDSLALRLELCQPARLVPWWHPDFADHVRCSCRLAHTP